ncbi:MAG: dihydropteroate synthase [Candidatus Cloacimonetes bacterium 4572_55]|nr:MAG: dihydropteroate synthase [Candidatus Cloacimonetes bacterium 4572_55]
MEHKKDYRIPWRNGVLNLSARTHIMGIINLTPDSFSDGGKYLDANRAVDHAWKLVEDGADILDFGGESTRPGSEPVSLDEESRRVLPVIEAVIDQISAPVSIDTYKSQIARRALDIGCDIVNDISGLRFDKDMAGVIAERDAACVLMHIKGTPRDMQRNPVYNDVMKEISDYLQESIRLAEEGGIDPKKIIVDPGIGFGKRMEDNINIHRNLRKLNQLNKPILFGSSRKSFLGQILDLPVDQRMEGTIASVAVAVINGAHIVRVHDTLPIKRAIRTIDALIGKSA